MKREKILDRIAKLLALAENNPSEHESVSALESAHKMMVKYNVSRADLEDHEYVREFITTNQGGPWARSIANGIGKLNFCMVIYSNHGKRKDVYNFIGEEENVKVAKMITEHVLKTVQKLARQGGTTPYLNSFRNAASFRIRARCDELRDTSTAEPGTGIVLASVYDQVQHKAEAYAATLGMTTRTVASRSRSSSSQGYRAGTNAGNSINLRPSIKN